MHGLDDSARYLTPASTDPWAASAAAAGLTGTQQLRDVAEVPAPDWVVDAFRLPRKAASTVVVRRRTMFLDGDPVELTDTYYPASIATGTALAIPKKIRGGAPAELARLGYFMPYADQAIDLDGHATEYEARLLGIDEGERVVRVRRTAFTSDANPVQADDIVMIPTGRVLRERIDLTGA